MAGIGSRETPDDILDIMYEFAADAAEAGYTLRSGGAPGADTAFELGCSSMLGPKEIFLPWPRFNQNTSNYTTAPVKAFQIAAEHHPFWHNLKYTTKKLMARNTLQVLGQKLDDPVKFVVCWTPDGSLNGISRESGGTGQALRIADAYGIPVFNLQRDDHREDIIGIADIEVLLS